MAKRSAAMFVQTREGVPTQARARYPALESMLKTIRENFERAYPADDSDREDGLQAVGRVIDPTLRRWNIIVER